MKYADVDNNTGEIKGWYSEEVHGENIPKNAIKVTEKVWRNALEKDHNHIDKNGKTSYVDFSTKEEKAQRMKNNAIKYLKETQWYFIRQLETGEPMPEDIKTQRIDAWSKIDLSVLK